ncbi:MAG: YetF domain-containing protein [Pyrinomonadaceae bacterium]
MWRGMFELSLPVADKIIRTVLVYFALVLLLRVFGKRELAQLNPFDLVVLLSLSNTVQSAFIGDDNSVTGGLVGALTLLATNYLVVRFIFRHRRLDQLLEGTPTVLIENGTVRRDGLAKELLTESELLAVAHRQGFARLEDINSCTLEPGGAFFIEGTSSAGDTNENKEIRAELSQIVERLDALSRQLAVLRHELHGKQ